MTEKMTIAEYRKRAKKGPKYRNKKAVVDGIGFDSIKEGDRYKVLRLLEHAGEIEKLLLQKKIKLIVNEVHVCTYEADFYYFDVRADKWVVEDTKSPATRRNPLYRLKKKLLKAIMGIDILET